MRLLTAEAAIAAGEIPLWLCTIRLPDGRAIRQATRPVEVACAWAGADGPYQYDPFLVGVSEFEEELDIFSLDGVGALTQARIEIAAPGTGFAALHSDWYHLTAATVELALLWEGQAWEERLVLLDGGIQGAELGLDGQASEFSLETTPPATSAMVGDDTRDMGVDWPAPLTDFGAGDTMTDLAGVKYVWVYGAAESIPAYKVGEVTAGLNRLVLCGHDLVRTGASYLVEVFADGVSVGNFTATNGTINGLPYAYVESSTEFHKADGAYTWKATYGGIAAADGSNRPALNADGITRRLLVDSGLRIDWRRTEPCLAKLRDWRLAFWADQEASAIDLLRDRVLAHLPVVEMSGGDGLWLAYCDPHHAPIEATLIVGQNLVGRVGRMEFSDLETIRNAFTVNYGHEVFADELLSTARIDADNSALCELSQQLYGVRADDVIECDSTWNEATALRVGGARASRLALPRRILTYLAAPDVYWLRAGMVVALVDPDYGIDKHRAVVTRVNRTMFPFRVRLELVDRTPIARAGG